MRRALWFVPAVAIAVTPLFSPAAAQCITGGAGGTFPGAGALTGVWDSSLPTAPWTSTLAVTVPAGTTVISSVELRGLTHTWSGDTHIVLTSPSGVNYNLLVLADSTSSGGAGCGTDFGGDYSIVDAHSAGNSCNPGALNFDCAPIYPPGTYAQRFSTWTSGNGGLLYTPLESIPIASGNWTIALYDWYPAADNGILGSWEMCFGQPSTPVVPCPPPPVCNELSTLFAGGNGGNNGGQVFFDMTVTKATGINLSQVAVNTGEPGVFTVDVYTKPTTYVGFTANQAGWTLLTTGSGTAAGANLASIADVADVVIPAGTYGVALVLDIAHGFDYTNGTGANQNFSNADVSIAAGAAQISRGSPRPSRRACSTGRCATTAQPLRRLATARPGRRPTVACRRSAPTLSRASAWHSRATSRSPTSKARSSGSSSTASTTRASRRRRGASEARASCA